MFNILMDLRRVWAGRVILSFVLLVFIVSSPGTYSVVYAQTYAGLPAPGTLMAAGHDYAPAILKGIKVDAQDIFKLSFILDQGDTKLDDAALREETALLLRYFLTALTMPESDIWVNLSPYEANRIVLPQLGTTELGRDLLAQDYILKQLSSSLTYPETPAGRAYWRGLQSNVQLFNKIWISPGETQILEHENTAFIKEAKLNVQMEEDYLACRQAGLAMQKNYGRVGANNHSPATQDAINRVSIPNDNISAFKVQILPLIVKEVNSGEHFAKLRQIHNAVVLAAWFKQHLKDTIYNKLYIDKKKSGGIDTSDAASVEKIYAQYVEAFKKGAYNYTKKERVGANDYSPAHKIIKRQYYSGGETENGVGLVVHNGTLSIPERTLLRAMLADCHGPTVVRTTVHPMGVVPDRHSIAAGVYGLAGEVTTAVTAMHTLIRDNHKPVPESKGRTYGEEDALYHYFIDLPYSVAVEVFKQIHHELSGDILPFFHEELERMQAREQEYPHDTGINPMGSLMLAEDLQAEKIVVPNEKGAPREVEPAITTYVLNPLTAALEPRDFTAKSPEDIDRVKKDVQLLGKKLVDGNRAQKHFFIVSRRNRAVAPLGSARISFDESVILDDRLARLGVDDRVLIDAFGEAVKHAGGQGDLGDTSNPVVIECTAKARHIAENHTSYSRYVGLNGPAIERVDNIAVLKALKALAPQIAVGQSHGQHLSADDTEIIRIIRASREEAIPLAIAVKCQKILITAALAHEATHIAGGRSGKEFELEQRSRDWEFIVDLCAGYGVPVALFVEVLRASGSFVQDAGLMAHYDIQERINSANSIIVLLGGKFIPEHRPLYDKLSNVAHNLFLDLERHPQFAVTPVQFDSLWKIIQNLPPVKNGVSGGDIDPSSQTRSHFVQAAAQAIVNDHRLFSVAMAHLEGLKAVSHEQLWLCEAWSNILDTAIRTIDDEHLKEVALKPKEHAQLIEAVELLVNGNSGDRYRVSLVNEFADLLSRISAHNRNFLNQLIDAAEANIGKPAADCFLPAIKQALAMIWDNSKDNDPAREDVMKRAANGLAWETVNRIFRFGEGKQVASVVCSLARGSAREIADYYLVQHDHMRNPEPSRRNFHELPSEMRLLPWQKIMQTMPGFVIANSDDRRDYLDMMFPSNLTRITLSSEELARKLVKDAKAASEAAAVTDEGADGGFSEDGLRLKTTGDNAFKLSAKNVSLNPDEIKGFELTITSIDRGTLIDSSR